MRGGKPPHVYGWWCLVNEQGDKARSVSYHEEGTDSWVDEKQAWTERLAEQHPTWTLEWEAV